MGAKKEKAKRGKKREETRDDPDGDAPAPEEKAAEESGDQAEKQSASREASSAASDDDDDKDDADSSSSEDGEDGGVIGEGVDFSELETRLAEHTNPLRAAKALRKVIRQLIALAQEHGPLARDLVDYTKVVLKVPRCVTKILQRDTLLAESKATVFNGVLADAGVLCALWAARVSPRCPELLLLLARICAPQIPYWASSRPGQNDAIADAARKAHHKKLGVSGAEDAEADGDVEASDDASVSDSDASKRGGSASASASEVGDSPLPVLQTRAMWARLPKDDRATSIYFVEFLDALGERGAFQAIVDCIFATSGPPAPADDKPSLKASAAPPTYNSWPPLPILRSLLIPVVNARLYFSESFSKELVSLLRKRLFSLLLDISTKNMTREERVLFPQIGQQVKKQTSFPFAFGCSFPFFETNAFEKNT
jgi:hypothetical protein